jgi:hypothetical protein
MGKLLGEGRFTYEENRDLVLQDNHGGEITI